MAKFKKVINRVIVLKLTGPQSKPFEAHFLRSFNATRLLFNEVACWGHDTITTRTSAIDPVTGAPVFAETELVSQRKLIYEATDKSITFENFSKALKLIYTALVSTKQGRGMVSVIIGEPQSKDLMAPKDWTTVDTLLSENALSKKINEEEGLLYRISNTLKAMGFRNRQPYLADLSAGERYSVVENVHRMLTSWIAVSNLTIENYDNEEQEIANLYSNIDKAVLAPTQKFLDACLTKQIIKHFDARVHSYLKHCVIPALQAGEEITNHFFLGKKEEKIQYSLHTDFVDLLKASPELWQGEDPSILKTIHVLEALMSHESHRPNSAYPFIKEGDVHRFNYFLGKNYTKYVAVGEGKDIEADVTVEVEGKMGKEPTSVVYTEGKEIQNLNITVSRGTGEDGQYTFKLCTQDKYHGGTLKPNTYLNGMSMWTNSDKQSMYLRFNRKSLSVDAIVREPSVVCRDGQFFLRMSMEVQTAPSEEIVALKWYLSSAAPATKTDRAGLKDEPKNLERLELLKGTAYRFMGVDLGLRSPFAWAVGESVITGVANTMKILSSGEMTATPDPIYTTLLYDLKNTSKVLGITKSLAMGKTASFNNFVTKTIQNAQAFFSTYGAGGTRKQAIYAEFCKDQDPFGTLQDLLAKHKNDLVAVKKDPSYLGNLLINYVDLMFGVIKEQRRMHLKDQIVQSKFSQEFHWLRIMEQMKRTHRSISYLGTDNSRTPIVQKNLTGYYNNCKDNFLKQIASAIVEIAQANDCKVIVMEDLNGPSKTLMSREENFLQAFWSPARIKGAIENAAQWYGIEVAEVSESQTSRVHHQSGRFGYRSGADFYYLDAKGAVQTVNADINAAMNIAARFVSRHTDLRQAYPKSISDDQGKRTKGFLTHHFGTVNKALEYFKGVDSKNALWYRDGSEWITLAQRNERVDAIKALVENMKMRVAS